MKNISIIVAVAENNVIGSNNQLIWHISEDLKRFKALTTGHHVIMGRKTFESIGKPLPRRVNVVLTRDQNFKVDGCLIASTLDEAINLCEGDDQVFIIGGGELYRLALPIAEKLYLTRIHKPFEGDVFFPEINEDEWVIESEQKGQPSENNGIQYTFVNLVRKIR